MVISWMLQTAQDVLIGCRAPFFLVSCWRGRLWAVDPSSRRATAARRGDVGWAETTRQSHPDVAMGLLFLFKSAEFYSAHSMSNPSKKGRSHFESYIVHPIS